MAEEKENITFAAQQVTAVAQKYCKKSHKDCTLITK
jgi:hypothetical protein